MPYKRLVDATDSFCEIDQELEQLWRRTYLSNDALVTALKRLRESYVTVLTVTRPPKDNEKVLAQVESALAKAAEVRNWL